MYVYLGGIFCHFASLFSSHSVPFNKLLNHVHVSSGSCYQICWLTTKPCWQNTVRHCLVWAPEPFYTVKTGQEECRRNHSRDHDCTVETEIYSTSSLERFQWDSCTFAIGILLFPSPTRLSQGLKTDPSPFDAESSHFPQDFDTKLAKKPRACKKRLWRNPNRD